MEKLQGDLSILADEFLIPIDSETMPHLLEGAEERIKAYSERKKSTF